MYSKKIVVNDPDSFVFEKNDPFVRFEIFENVEKSTFFGIYSTKMKIMNFYYVFFGMLYHVHLKKLIFPKKSNFSKNNPLPPYTATLAKMPPNIIVKRGTRREK